MGFRQGGQSLPLMAVFILVLFSVLVYLYDSGRLLLERTRLALTADQAAYAAATQNARLLNLNAYLNRAAIANQLAVAQAVSVSSWGMFVQPIPRTSAILLTPPMTPVGVVVQEVSQGVALTMRPIAESMGAFVVQNQVANRLLRTQQRLLNVTLAPMAAQKAAKRIMVVSGMDAEGVRLRWLVSGAGVSSFLYRYAGDERQRLAQVMMESREPFTKARVRWNQEFGVVKCEIWAPGVPYFELVKRGGTQLEGLDEWKGMDTFSVHTYTGYWKHRRWRLPRWVCGHSEYPVGYGSTAVARNRDGDDGSGAAFDYSRAANPVGSSRSGEMLTHWDVRSGVEAMEPAVPEYYDLSEALRDDNGGFPRLAVAVKVVKPQSRLLVTDQASQVRVGRSLQMYTSLPETELAALARAETYFDRPADVYLNGGMQEKASLFNPYWRARLVALGPEDRVSPGVPVP